MGKAIFDVKMAKEKDWPTCPRFLAGPGEEWVSTMKDKIYEKLTGIRNNKYTILISNIGNYINY